MTELVYLEDTYNFCGNAKVLEVKETEKGTVVILDKTIFYPQGGGQPADKGIITSKHSKFIVEDVRLDANGTVNHFGFFEGKVFTKGEEVELQIEEDRRRLNAKLHSAGHIIDIAARNAGFPFKCVKSYHFPDGPYLEYEGSEQGIEQYLTKISEISNQLVLENLPMIKRLLSSEEAAKMGWIAPEGKQVRVVNFGNYPEVGCGGTHVNSSVEIGEIIIKKVSAKKGNTKIVYTLA